MPSQRGPGFTNTSPVSDQVVAKLGSEDLRRLHQAVAQKKATVTVPVAAKPGSGKSPKAAIKAAGGSVGGAEDQLGYMRASVPTTSVNGLPQRSDVLAIDLNGPDATPNPQLAGPAGATAEAIAPPGATTPANKPYLPVNETGSVDFVATYPQWDGRGITVGVLDSGVDLDHPALQRTTTGVPKVVDWVTATDPVIDSDLVHLGGPSARRGRLGRRDIPQRDVPQFDCLPALAGWCHWGQPATGRSPALG